MHTGLASDIKCIHFLQQKSVIVIQKKFAGSIELIAHYCMQLFVCET